MNVPSKRLSYNQPQSLGDDYQSSRPINNQLPLTNSLVNKNDDEQMSVPLKIFTCIICSYYCCPCYLSYLLYTIIYGDDTQKTKSKENKHNYPNTPSILNVNNTIIRKNSKNQRNTISNVTPISFNSNHILRGSTFQGFAQNEEKKIKTIYEDIDVIKKKEEKRFTVNSSILTVDSKRKSATLSELISKRLEKEKNKKEIKEIKEREEEDKEEKENENGQKVEITKLNVNGIENINNKDKKNNTDISEVSD